MDTLKAWGRVLFDYIELVLAAAIGGVVAVLAATGDIRNPGSLTEATVGVLVALAIGVIRERFERRSVSERIENTLRLTVGEKAWQVLDEHLTWNLTATNGSRAEAIVRRRLQFMQDEVFCIYEYQHPAPGSNPGHTCRGGAPGEPMADLPILKDDFPGADGRTYRIISLQRIWRRGEIMNFASTRELEDHFLTSREYVSKDVPVPTTRLSMRVYWPKERKPTSLWVERTDRPRAPIKVKRLRQERLERHGLTRRRTRGRWTYEEVIASPALGERVALWWTW